MTRGDAAEGDHHVGLGETIGHSSGHRLDVVAKPAGRDQGRPGLLEQRTQHREVAVANRSFARRIVDAEQLVPVESATTRGEAPTKGAEMPREANTARS
jgi:hypothetical protein